MGMHGLETPLGWARSPATHLTRFFPDTVDSVISAHISSLLPAKEGLILLSPVLCLQCFSGGEGRELDFQLWLAKCEESELNQVKRILHAQKMLSFQVTPSHARLRNDMIALRVCAILSDCMSCGGGRRWAHFCLAREAHRHRLLSFHSHEVFAHTYLPRWMAFLL